MVKKINGQEFQTEAKAADVAVVSRCVEVMAELPYSLYEQALRVAEAHGARVSGTTFTDRVTLQLVMLAGTEPPLLEEFSNLTSGQVEFLVGTPFDEAF